MRFLFKTDYQQDVRLFRLYQPRKCFQPGNNRSLVYTQRGGVGVLKVRRKNG